MNIRKILTGMLMPSVILSVLAGGMVQAQERNLAPGFLKLPPNAKVVVMPTDIELFSLSAGGVAEPKADWTEAATKHFKRALVEKKKKLGVVTLDVTDKDADEFSEINELHGAVARAVGAHHFGPGFLNLPTKDGKLDWSMGESVMPIRQKTGADYALFTWIRDSYASAERVITMIALAAFGIGVGGGMQTGYASLIDLNTGQVVWFNRLLRAGGDLREAEPAVETLESLLDKFPSVK